ncbi:hypothetical protein CCGE531_31515 (plasmid) [Rhizobium sp. CCGE531]|nr:hypothetical protein CCGE531_31515 [Rhizobium sp. CCGE531]
MLMAHGDLTSSVYGEHDAGDVRPTHAVPAFPLGPAFTKTVAHKRLQCSGSSLLDRYHLCPNATR